MRKTREIQSTIFDIFPSHKLGQQYHVISRLLDQHPRFLTWVSQDLGSKQVMPTGRTGLSAESLLRAGIVMQIQGFTYQELAIYISDSHTFRAFCRVGTREPSRSALQEGIAKITPATWEKINRGLLVSAQEEGIEKGRVIRIDSTPVESDIHQPSDARLLEDAVRVMARLVKQARESFPKISFADRNRAVKRRVTAIAYGRKEANRQANYRALMKYTEETLGYLKGAMAAVPASDSWRKWREKAGRIAGLTKRVLSQTQKRVFENEQVKSDEKVVSLFEPHSDIIVKGSRDITYGHKVNLTAGKSGMVLDLVVEEGNPCDSTRALPMVVRQTEIYGRPPRQCAFDGGYASKDNLRVIKDLGIKDVMFQKKRGLKVEEMTRSEWVYMKLRRFRAGIESVISCLKRAFGWSRCTWKSLEGFKAYLWSSAVAFNLAFLGKRLSTAKT